MRHFYLFALLFIPFNGTSQINTPTWGVEDTIIVISKTTDFGPVHDYIEVFNNSGQDLDMRWICHEPPSWPALWETNFTDPPQNQYYDVGDLDSADFILTDPVSFLNKCIIGVQHQSYAHWDTVVFEVFPLDYPQDVLYLHYVIKIDQGSAWASLDEDFNDVSYFVDDQNALHLKTESTIDGLIVYDLNGKAVFNGQVHNLSGESLYDLSGLGAGVFVLSLNRQGVIESFKISLN